MNDLDETWKIKSSNEAQSIQSIKVRTLISYTDGDKKHSQNLISSGINDKTLYTSTSDGSSQFASKNENKLITSITLNSEQKKKYEDYSRKYIDLKQKLVIY